MYEVSVDAAFCAIHRVPLSTGELEPVHGHDWEVTVTFAGPTLDQAGLLVDFVLVEERLRAIAAQMHHTDLNINPAMQGVIPSAENVARAIYDLLASDANLRPVLARVCVKEAPGCRATYLGPHRA
jgi:6-pyruvoyltetrahydropterin/6-carboxytetrahydropterin synthase